MLRGKLCVKACKTAQCGRQRSATAPNCRTVCKPRALAVVRRNLPCPNKRASTKTHHPVIDAVDERRWGLTSERCSLLLLPPPKAARANPAVLTKQCQSQTKRELRRCWTHRPGGSTPFPPPVHEQHKHSVKPPPFCLTERASVSLNHILCLLV